MNDMTIAIATPGEIEHDLGRALQDTALLAHVKISVWDGMKSDKTILEEVKTRHGARGDVGKMIKNLLAGADGPLKSLRSAYAAVRMRHYELTLPWVSDTAAERKTGPRLLPHPLFQRSLTELGALKRAAFDELEDFLPRYPDLVTTARQNLGGMADADYPTIEDVRSRFRIYQDFEPIPDGTGFRGLPENMLDRLSKHLTDRQQRQREAAAGAMWQEAKERIGHLVERLSTEDAKFKEASIRAVRELVTLLPGWNINGDGRVAEIAADIRKMMDGIEASDLRKDASLRGTVADEAKRVADKLAKWNL
jgi:hypothetical protein